MRFMLVALICFSMMVSVTQAQEGLVGYWSFDEGSGAVAFDQSPHGNDGDILGATWAPGVVGGGLDFDPANEAFVSIPSAEVLNVAAEATLMAWIKPRSIYIGGEWQQRNCIVAKLRAYYLDINEEGKLATYFYGLDPVQWMVGTTQLESLLDEWFHVAVSWDGKNYRLYLNGKLEAEEGRTGAITITQDPLTIGYVDNNRYFDGAIDEVQLYDRALDDAEITAFSTLSVEPGGKLSILWAQIRATR